MRGEEKRDKRRRNRGETNYGIITHTGYMRKGKEDR